MVDSECGTPVSARVSTFALLKASGDGEVELDSQLIGKKA
jgi:hypothetical protein